MFDIPTQQSSAPSNTLPSLIAPPYPQLPKFLTNCPTMPIFKHLISALETSHDGVPCSFRIKLVNPPHRLTTFLTRTSR
jgi:hypothetical protein